MTSFLHFRLVNFLGMYFHHVVFFHLLCDLEIQMQRHKSLTGINRDASDRVRVDIKLDVRWKKQQTRVI